MNLMKFLPLVFLAFYTCKTDNRKEVDQYDYSGIESLKLKGVINDLYKPKFPAFHGYGVLYLDIIESNIKDYDPTEYQANYLVRIKGQKAELFCSFDFFEIGDTIKIDIPNKSMRYYSRTIKNYYKFKPDIYDRSLFDYLEENGYLRL